MNIGLLGFTTADSNLGCNALTYSFLSILNGLGKENLNICFLCTKNTSNLKDEFPLLNIKGYEFSRRDITFAALRALRKCDVVFDCTFGDNFSDIYDLAFVNQTTSLKEKVLKNNIRLVLAPQTIGPFQNQNIKERAAEILKKSDLIFSRDDFSSQYAQEISSVIPITVTDLAFALPYYTNMYQFTNQNKVGINISGLLWKGGFSRDNQFHLTVDYQIYIKKLIEVFKKRHVEVHLIPHVIASRELQHDDDYDVCKELAEKNEVICAPIFETPIQAKSYISNMDFFVGARMHSTIAAFSSGVPTVPFSYSRKFEGMYNSFGYTYLIDAKKMDTSEALEKTIYYFENLTILRSAQVKSMEMVDKMTIKFKKSLKEYLNSIER